MQALEAKQSKDHELLTQRIDGVREEITAAEDRQESRRLELLGRSVFREEAGVWIFIFGLLVSTVGVLV